MPINFLTFLPKFVKNEFCLANIFQLQKYQVFVLGNMHKMHTGQQSLGKLRLHKRLLYDKQNFENATLSFAALSLFDC